MNKPTIICLLLLSTCLMWLAGCRSEQPRKTDYTHAVPANATEVAAIDLAAIVEKAGLNAPDAASTKQRLWDLVMGGCAPELNSQLRPYLDHPEDMGIDWQQPVILFRSPSLYTAAATLKITDLQKFEQLIALLVQHGICPQPAEMEGYKTFNFRHADVQLAYNDGTLLAVYARSTAELQKLTPVIGELMNQPAEKSVHQHPHYAGMMAQHGDIRLMGTPETLPFEMRGILHWPHGTPLSGYLLFENGYAYAMVQQAGFTGDTREGNQPFHPRNAQELQQALAGMMHGHPFNIALTTDELLTLSNLRVRMEFDADDPSVSLLYRIANMIETVNMRGDQNRVNFSIALHDKSSNALKQLADLAKALIGM